MFDTTCANPRAWIKNGVVIPASDNCPSLKSKERIGILSWQEHCVECGQPECFKNCKFFERSFDGKCRRFENGIVYDKGLHICSFRPWAKLEAVYTGRVWSVHCERFFSVIDRGLCSIARLINRLMAFVPGRIGAITIYRRLKLWMERLLPGNKSNKMYSIVVNVWANRAVKVHFTVIDGNREIFTETLALSEGWSRHNIMTHPIRRGSRLLFFSTDDNPFTLAFQRFDLSSETGIAMINERKVSEEPSSSAKFVKCIAWDLDNTLWNGILVEDGVEKLQLNSEAVKVIQELDKRGIVHTVVSKNEHELAWSALERFGMAEYFIYPHINWLPKSANITAAAKEININLNTFAFIDDSSFERGEVGEKCPQVRVFSEQDIPNILTREEFNPPISSESAGRRASYKKEMQRVAAAAIFDGDYKEFLKSCRIELSFFDLREAHEKEYERCYELIQRSNQLTLTGNRYSQDEFKELISGDDIKSWGIRCKDKFGDYGIIGCIVVKEEGKGEWRVKEFVMSCRVAKKGCEAMAIKWVKEETKKSGGFSLKADIVDTGRNGALKEAFSEIEW